MRNKTLDVKQNKTETKQLNEKWFNEKGGKWARKRHRDIFSKTELKFG